MVYSVRAAPNLTNSWDMKVSRVRTTRRVSLTEVAAWAVVLLALIGALAEFFRWLGEV